MKKKKQKVHWIFALAGAAFAAVGIYFFTPAATGSWNLSAIFFILIGVVVAIFGIWPLAKAARKAKEGERLKKDGTMLWAEYMGCETRMTAQVDGHPVWETTLHCAGTDAQGQTYTFTRAGLEEDPLPFLKDGRLRVYYQRDDISRYYIDVLGSYEYSGIVKG